jgi:DNA-binding MarR family transcriptional regulator
MNQDIDSDVRGHIQDLYADDANAQSLFDWVASRKNDTAETTIRRICEKTGMARSDAVRLVKTLSDMGCGEFIVGRKGAESRIRWRFSIISLGKAAQGEGVELDEVDPELAEDVADQQSPGIASEGSADQPLTIADAKRRLAATFGVKPEAIEIIVRA